MNISYRKKYKLCILITFKINVWITIMFKICLFQELSTLILLQRSLYQFHGPWILCVCVLMSLIRVQSEVCVAGAVINSVWMKLTLPVQSIAKGCLSLWSPFKWETWNRKLCMKRMLCGEKASIDGRRLQMELICKVLVQVKNSRATWIFRDLHIAISMNQIFSCKNVSAASFPS